MRPSRWQVVTLVVALCFLTGVVGWWIGRPSDPSFNDVDVGFLSDMETHHGGAISLAFAYIAREHDSLVGQIAREIVLEESQEISVMNAYLGQAGPRNATTDDVAMDWMGLAVPISRMPGMPTNQEMSELRAAQGATADEIFTRLMINHHAAGVAMADFADAHGENDNVRHLAAPAAEDARVRAGRREGLEDLHAEHSG